MQLCFIDIYFNLIFQFVYIVKLFIMILINQFLAYTFGALSFSLTNILLESVKNIS